MNYYLAPWVEIEAGQRPDGRPQPGYAPQGVVAGQAFTTIDLRPHGVGAGDCLLALDDAMPGAFHVSETGDLDSHSSAMRRLLQTRLGITLSATSFRDAVAEIMIQHAREDGTRWRPLRPTRGGRYEIWLGNEKMYDRPVIAGGTAFTSTFTEADTDTPAGFTQVVGDWDILSNQLLLATANGNCTIRADADLGGVDHYAQVVMKTLPSDSSSGYGACTRFSALVETCYMHRYSKTNTRYEIWTIVAGSYSFLASGGTVTAADDVIKGESNGSTQTVYRNGSSQATVSNSTIDGTIVGGPRAGLYGNNANGATQALYDDYASDLLGGAALSIPVATHTYKQRRVLV